MHFAQTCEFAIQKVESTGIFFAFFILRIQILREIYKILQELFKVEHKKID